MMATAEVIPDLTQSLHILSNEEELIIKPFQAGNMIQSMEET